MGSVVHTLGVLLCVWGSGMCAALQRAGPCVVNSSQASFDCSGRGLQSIPQDIWSNVTYLDLSDNRLNLSPPASLKSLSRFSHLVTLNLSGNYLPLLATEHLHSLRTLQVLDLRRCELARLKPGALQGLPRLQTLFLGNNPLQDPLSALNSDLEGVQFLDLRLDPRFSPDADERSRTEEPMGLGDPERQTQRGRPTGLEPILSIHGSIQRRLLQTSANGTGINENNPSHSWKYLVAVLVMAISISVSIALVAKCKLFQKYLASYRHSRLSETDGASQCDPAALEVGFSTQGPSGHRSHSAAPHGEDEEEEDDDGFIEDNYIQASERERAAKAAVEIEDPELEDDMFTIS